MVELQAKKFNHGCNRKKKSAQDRTRWKPWLGTSTRSYQKKAVYTYTVIGDSYVVNKLNLKLKRRLKLVNVKEGKYGRANRYCDSLFSLYTISNKRPKGQISFLYTTATPTIRPGLIFFQKVFWWAYFWGRLNLGGNFKMGWA